MRIFQIMKKGCKFINGNQWIVVRGIETEAKSHTMFLVPEFIEKLGALEVKRIAWLMNAKQDGR
ncbi:hypothetical protein O5258_12165 [Escherichia coli]|nr:hypothetical protein [Escherichia coli]